MTTFTVTGSALGEAFALAETDWLVALAVGEAFADAAADGGVIALRGGSASGEAFTRANLNPPASSSSGSGFADAIGGVLEAGSAAGSGVADSLIVAAALGEAFASLNPPWLGAEAIAEAFADGSFYTHISGAALGEAFAQALAIGAPEGHAVGEAFASCNAVFDTLRGEVLAEAFTQALAKFRSISGSSRGEAFTQGNPRINSVSGSALGEAITEADFPLISFAGAAVGEAFTQMDARFNTTGGAAFGEAFTQALAKFRSVSGDVVGEAFTQAGVHVGISISGSAVGEAVIAPVEFGLTKTLVLQEVLGEAFTSAEAAMHYAFAPPELLGEAFIPQTGSEQYRPFTVPPLAGDAVDVGNNSVFQLTVDGNLLDFATEAFDVEDLLISYDGRELSFSQITGIDSPTFQNEHLVELDIDFTGTGSVLERIFTGRIRQREHQGVNNDELVRYNAVGYQALTNDITAVNTQGRPQIEFTVGTTVLTVTSITTVETTFSKTVREAIQEVFEINASRLNTFGIPATIGVPGLESFDAQLPETVEFINTGFVQTINQLAAYQPGVRPFWDDFTQTWIFPNLLNAVTAVVQVESVNLLELPYTADTDDRYTAVRLIANIEDALDDAIVSKAGTVTIGGNTGSVQRTTVSLTKKWLESLEDDWTTLKGLSADPRQLEDQNFWVYRRWEMPAGLAPPWPGTPVVAFQKVNFWGEIKWQKLRGRADFRRREFVANYPAIERGNPYLPGDVIGLLDVQMAYYPLQFFFVYPASVTSEGTPVSSVGTDIDSTEFLDEIRLPTSGWTGTAFTQFGVERELVQVVDRTEVNTRNAQAILDVHKDVIISAELPIDGDPIRDFMSLDKKLVVRHADRNTGIETYGALATSYRYQFGKRGQSQIELSTELTGLIKQTQ